MHDDTKPEDNGLEEGSMSFLDHLDELRTRLIRCALFIAVAFVVSWSFSDKIYHFIEIPVRAQMMEAKRAYAEELKGVEVTPLKDLSAGIVTTFTFPRDCRIGEALIPAGTTIRARVENQENGARQLVTDSPWIVNNDYVIKEGFPIPQDLLDPKAIIENPDNRLMVLTVTGAFNLYIKVAFFTAIFFGVPFILVQAWGFIAPGLYPHEKKYSVPILIMATVFFLMGCAFSYYIAFPRAANILLGWAAAGNLRPQVTADEYFDLILMMTLGLGVVFEIPTITFFLSRLGLITPRLLLKIWRPAILVIFIVAAVLSPTTDIPNLFVFAIPMCVLYFFSVGVAWISHRERHKE